MSSTTRYKSNHSLHASNFSVKTVEREKKKLGLKTYPDDDIKFRHTSSTKHCKRSSLNVNQTEITLPSNEDELESSLLFEPALDYSLNEDGSVTCKICRETVPSRTHWYRHKYKVTSV